MPSILSSRKDHHQGRAHGRVAYSDGASATLYTDLPQQRPGSYQEDREESMMAVLISGRSREELIARSRDDRTE